MSQMRRAIAKDAGAEIVSSLINKVVSCIINQVCPECGGYMMGFQCQGQCRTDWRSEWQRLQASTSPNVDRKSGAADEP